MSRILRRPMFRGGPVSSYGTGIATGLGYNDGGRVGYKEGGISEEDKSIILQQVITDLGPNATQEDIVTEFNSRTGLGEYKFSETPIAKAGEGIMAYGPNAAIAGIYDLAAVPINTVGRLFGYNPGLSGTKFVDTLTGGRFSEFTGYDPDKAKFLGFDTSAKEGFTTASKVSDENIKKQVEEIKQKNLENQNNNQNNNNDGGNLNNFQEKSDKEVMQEYMDMFKESLGGDKEELNRQRFLEIAKFGANLLAQPGGQSLGEAVGKAGAPALEGFSKIEAAERAADRQAKTLGFQAALKELEPGSLEKNARALSKLSGGKITVAQAAKQLSENASAGTNTFRNKQLIAGSLETSPEIALKVANIVVNSDINIENVSKHPDPTKTTGNEKKGNYYYFEKAGPGGEVMGKWDGNKFILPGEKGFL